MQTCTDVRGDYSGTGLRCDEYPFASAEERGTDGLRYSARLIDGPENEEGGRHLNSMYTANRIVDGGAFYVTGVP
ncbi:NucA/NucB deoxyribonuclease domain-containing protein [Streptomyces sp. NPDC000931]|uniref:NucA/NucB deoxyribonuclease domain-containing protein n=1 Tax=Streptomyces sp. NPDC000931 TaxID=3154372 RepID=UPI0033222EA0